MAAQGLRKERRKLKPMPWSLEIFAIASTTACTGLAHNNCNPRTTRVGRQVGKVDESQSRNYKNPMNFAHDYEDFNNLLIYFLLGIQFYRYTFIIEYNVASI